MPFSYDKVGTTQMLPGINEVDASFNRLPKGGLVAGGVEWNRLGAKGRIGS